MVPDLRLSAVGANGFNSHSGLVANLYQIFDGSMQIQFQNNFKTISGTIDILGKRKTPTNDFLLINEVLDMLQSL